MIDILTNTIEFDKKIKLLYPNSRKDDIYKRYNTALNRFTEIFNYNNTNIEDIHIYSAPGRTEICGNHTDHQLGKVLAGSIDLDIIGIVKRNNSNVINVYCDGFEMYHIDIDEISLNKAEFGTSLSIIKGIIESFKKVGCQIDGLNIYTTSNIPVGSGLSSSAAFENLFSIIFNDLFYNNKLNQTELSILCKEVENNFFGKPCGLMDQAACCFGGIVYIDFKDKNNPYIEPLNTDFLNKNYNLLLVDCKASHADLTDDYADITNEMREVANCFNKKYLSELSLDIISSNTSHLRTVISDRAILRSIHYFNEVGRVEAARNAIKEKNEELFLKQVENSGISSQNLLQNIYSNRFPKNQSITLGLELSKDILDKNGVVRIHGGGFAGCIQAFVKKTYTQIFTQALKQVFGDDCCLFISIRQLGSIKVF